MPTIHLTKAQWGGAYKTSEGKLKVYRKPADASQRIRQRKSRKKTVISRAKSARFNQP